MHWSEQTLAVLDFETTGLDTSKDRIVEAALLFVEPDGSLHSESYHTIVNPGVPIPEGAAAVHGITDERAKAERPAAKMRHFAGCDFLIVINEAAWYSADADRRLALMDHELMHCGWAINEETGARKYIDGHPAWTIVPHDLEEFAAIVRRHGLWRSDVKQFVRQASLFGDQEPERKLAAVGG